MYLADVKTQFVLLRIPLLSEVESVVRYSDLSLNSELIVIQKLSVFALMNNTVHKIILMVELGDLREGIMPSELDETIEQVLKLEGIELKGIGTNLSCFGGIQPDESKMQFLSSLVVKIEKKFKIKLDIISGGNSANYSWFRSTKNTGRINNLRIGESIFLGCEAIHRKPISGLFTDAFTLIAEIIELKEKPSVPYGKKSENAFGTVTTPRNNGKIKRAILGIGLQDVVVSGLKPRIDIQLLGASSDHTIFDTNKNNLNVGDHLEFDLNYAALLSAMNSPYVSKIKRNNIIKS